jgi:ribosomal protein L40E
MKCPKCGATASGKFCSTCGTALGKQVCAKCGAALTPGAKFCHSCGASETGAGGGTAAPSATPWIIAGGAVVVLLIVLAVTQIRPPAPPAAAVPAASGGPVDLSQMSPKDAADRLFNRVMAANEGGATDTARFFAPMALQAYRMLEVLDADGRFHMGLIELVAGNTDGALAQADTIAAERPTHLFAAMLHADAFQARGDSAAMRRAQQTYLTNYDAELASGRVEYGHHTTWLATWRDRIRP